MHADQELLRSFALLFASANLAGMAKTLAASAGRMAGARRAGLFLLDDPKDHLLLYASWNEREGGKTEPLHPVPLNAERDPLCFSLTSGLPYQAELDPSPSMELLGAGRGAVFAVPLRSRGGVALGGLLLTGTEVPCPADAASVQLLAAYASALMDGLGQRRQDRSAIQTIRENAGRAERQARLARELARTSVVGTSEAIAQVRAMIVKAAPTDAPVLITGETGTGKEVAAEAIHSCSRRSAKPFVKINCGALPAELLESELFGHVRGAFTGADRSRPGLVRSADGGSLLLDEIGDMPVALQVKLLRFLQDKKARPVGDAQEYPANVRIMAATNRNLEKAMSDGSFRPDLYHRLAAVHIHIPPLRERPQDIVALCGHFLEKFTARHNRQGLSLDPGTICALSARELPGNARELACEIERAILLAEDASGSLSLLPATERATGSSGLRSMVNSYEKSLVRQTMDYFGGNVSKAAEVLRVPRSTLQSKLDRWAAGMELRCGSIQ